MTAALNGSVTRVLVVVDAHLTAKINNVKDLASYFDQCASLAYQDFIFCQKHLEQVFLPPTKEEVSAFARFNLSVCLLAKLPRNARMDLNEMLRVDR